MRILITILILCFSVAAFSQSGSQGSYMTPTVDLRTYKVTLNNTTSNNNAKINKAIADAVAQGIKRVHFPSGTILLDSSSVVNLFNITTNGFEIYGDGVGKTILVYPNVQINAQVVLFNFTGRGQSWHDITIQSLAQTGSGDITYLQADNGSFGEMFYNFDFSGMYGNSTAGGSGIHTYQLWNSREFGTTLAGSVTAGTRTITPGSMNGIYAGRQLIITGTNPENITVSSVTQTTFTATFASNHVSGDSALIYSQGNQYVTISNGYVHQAYKACGIILASSGNKVIDNCRFINIGANANQHAVYDQGSNLIDQFTIQGANFGAGIHGHKATPDFDASGSTYSNGTILDCGRWGIIVDGITNSLNPALPVSASLNRYTTIKNIVFRQSVGNVYSIGALEAAVPIKMEQCTFEDAYTTSGSPTVILDAGAAGSIVSNQNEWVKLNATPAGANDGAFRSNANDVQFSNNIVTNFGIIYFGASRITANSNNLTECKIRIDGSNITYQGGTINNATQDAFDYISGSNIYIGGVTKLGAGLVGNFDFSGISNMWFEKNKWPGTSLRYTHAQSLVHLVGNVGGISEGGNAVVEQTGNSGELLPLKVNASQSGNVGKGNLAKLVSGGLNNTATTDTTFVGVFTSDIGSGADTLYIVGDIGATVLVNTDGAWTKGNYGKVSTSTAGKISDIGATAPSTGSYMLFLNSGGSAGIATVKIIKTSNGLGGGGGGSVPTDTIKIANKGTGVNIIYTNGVDTLFGKTNKGLNSISVTTGADSTNNYQLTNDTTLTAANYYYGTSSVGRKGFYALNPAVIASTLTGYTSGAGTISSADNILQAIQKLNGNMPTSGTYTATLTNTANISSSTFSQATFTRVGNVVHVNIGGSLNITSLITNSTLTVSLPFTTATTTQIAVGNGAVIPGNSGFPGIAGLVQVTTATTARFDFYGTGSTSTSNFSISFDYIL